MNQIAKRISAACIFTALALPVGPAFARKVKNQHEKKVKDNPLANVDSKQPDKELFDKAMKALSKGRYDVTRLDLQVLLNTYPDSEYQMRAKLAVADSWFKEGGAAAYTQAESEYQDFITFFPNSPEAAEAQMRVADIYYMQMEKPDRDYSNVQRAEQEYRKMVQQFPDSTLVPRAKQRLRDVQEVLAQREYEIGQFYATQAPVTGNYAAGIARLQTVADTYPLFSHSDLALIALGDSYAAQGKMAQALKIAPAAKERLAQIYEDRAAEAYDRVVTRYPMAPHVEDAKDRLIALNRPIPEPTPQALAANEAEELSRTPVRLKERAIMLVKKGPSPVSVSRVGEPTLTDPAPVLAPQVSKALLETYSASVNGHPASTPALTTPAAAAPTAATSADTMTMQSVPDSSGSAAPAGTGIGVQVITPSANGNPAPETSIPVTPDGAAGTAQPSTQPLSQPADATSPATVPSTSVPSNVQGTTPAVIPDGQTLGIAPAALAADPNGGLKAVGPPDTAPLPGVERATEAPAQINDVKGSAPVQVSTGTGAPAANGKKKKNPKPAYNSSQESSSKHKKKKGLSKVNPF